jgi:phage baseplate assembly protein gpV
MADNRSTLHQGQATERNVNSASARVGFDDLAGTVSGFMQVLFPAAGGWNFFYTPKEGDQVVVSRLPNGAEEGYILGKVYTAGKMPQGGAKNIILMVSDNGKNIIRFDADNGTLDLVCDQACTMKFNSLDIEVKELTKIKTKNLDIEVEELTKWQSKEWDEVVDEGKTTKSGTLDESVREIITRTAGGDIITKAGGTNRDNGAEVHHN